MTLQPLYFHFFIINIRNEEKTRPEALKLAQIKLRNMTKDELEMSNELRISLGDH
jgi:hypothetical protein